MKRTRIRRFCSIMIFRAVVANFAILGVQAFSSVRPNFGSQSMRNYQNAIADFCLLRSATYDEDEAISPFADDFIDDDDDDDIDLTHSFLASPLSQVWGQEGDENSAWFPGSFSRKENWLENATDEILDVVKVPLGSLTEDDVESITGLMAAWVRRRSLDAAMAVERLLKRVVDDLKAGNKVIKVNARMYTIAMDAWAKSGEREGARRAQQIHDSMIELYKQTGDSHIAPTAVSFNTVMNAWSKSQHPLATEMAEDLFEQMMESEDEGCKPDVLTFSTLLDVYSRSNDRKAVQMAEEIFQRMDSLGIQRNVYTYSALQNVYGRSGRKDAPDLCMNVLETMLDLYKNGNVFAKPNCVNYNAVLGAYSRARTRKAAEQASAMLEKMERSDFDGGYDVQPDHLSYALTILACTRCPDFEYAVDESERILEKMEERAIFAAEKKRQISSAAPPMVRLDLESFNGVLALIAKSRRPDSTSRAIRIVQRMENYANGGYGYVAPNTRSWNAVLNSISRSGVENAGKKAEQILNHMFELHEKGVPNVKPDPYSFSAVISSYLRNNTLEAVENADRIVQRMEDLYSKGELENHPDTVHYTILCTGWARLEDKRASIRIVDILSSMMEKHRAGVPNIKPNYRTYKACLEAICRAGDVDKAEQLLDHMLTLARDGDNDARPDTFSFSAVISAFCRSGHRDAGLRAESVLERFIEFSEEYTDVKPDCRSFNHIIGYYARAKNVPDAPYRAEYLLNRWISMFRSGRRNLSPTTFAFTTVMDAYASQNHPDSGEYAERLMRTMLKLRRKYNATDVEVNTGVVNTVLNAYLCSGNPGAGERANALLREMESRMDQGKSDLIPNPRTYSLVMSIWSKANCSDKAEQTLRILKRVKKRRKEGKIGLPSNDFLHAIVVNACAFTNADAVSEKRAFDIAVEIMKELLDEHSFTKPAGTIFGWFFQACGRLNVDKSLKDENLEMAFSACCERGLVNDFVLDTFLGAASDNLLQKVLGTSIHKVREEKKASNMRDIREKMNLGHQPAEWRRSIRPMRKRPATRGRMGYGGGDNTMSKGRRSTNKHRS